MTGYVGRLRARLGLNTAEFDTAMTGAQTRARAGFAGTFAGIGRMITPLTVGFAAVAGSVYSIAAPALRAASSIDEAAKAARRVDGSLAGWESLRLSAGEAGVEVRALSDQIQNMNARLAVPSTGTSRVLRQLGLDAAELRAMDVDARLGAISDAVAGLGLDAGQTGAALRELGIEDRRMVGLVMAGGAAIRAARSDIEEYGLAVSDLDASAIETANDQMGRLSLVSRYFGQTMAVSVVPAMGAFAQMMTDSLREGGLLRGMIDGLGAGLGGFIGFVRDIGTIGGGFITWLRDLVAGAAQGDTALGSILRTVGWLAGEIWGLVRVISGISLVQWFADLIRAAGGFGEALTLLGNVADGVWSGLVSTAGAIPSGLSAVWNNIRADFTLMVRDLVLSWSSFLQAFSAGLPGLDMFDGMRSSINSARTDALRYASELVGTYAAARRAASEAQGVWESATSFDAARASLEELNAAVERGEVSANAATAAQRAFAEQLEQTGGSGGAAVSAVDAISDSARRMQTQLERGADAATSLIGSLVRGDWKSAMAQLLTQIAEAQLRMALLSAGGGSKGGGFLGTLGRLLLPGNARGTESWRGGLTVVGEEGPELVSLPQGARITPALATEKAIKGDGSGAAPSIVYNIDARGAQRGVAEEIAAQLDARTPALVQQAMLATKSAQMRGY